MSTAYSSAKQQYIGNGVTTEWGFDFPIKKHSELKVYLKRSGLTQVLLEEGVDYSFVTENAIAFPIKTGEAKLQAADVLALQRESVFESEYNFSNQQRLEPEEVMHADDNLERQIQELKRDVTQAIRIQPTSNINTDEYFIAVESIYENLDNITNVSGISAEIVNCSDNISDISTVSSDIANVNAVGQSISSVNTVASDISSVNVAATNIEFIKSAEGNANDAKNSEIVARNSAVTAQLGAALAQDWATKTDGKVEGTEYSSKYYAGQASNSAQQAAISAAGTHFKLFQHQWFDYELNDLAWLRADTFSWQSGTVYTNAYNHLVDDIDGITPATETVGGQTVTFYRAFDGHKIVLADQETTVNNIYTATGVAWYYILDTVNNRFKLPRTKYGFNGLRGNVGDYIPESLPNISGSWAGIYNSIGLSGAVSGTFKSDGSQPKTVETNETSQLSSLFDINASRSSSTYQNNAPVQQRGTQQYLYFYVGQYTQSAIEQTAGLNAELFNNKIDIDGNNVITAGANKILNTSSYTTNRILEIPQDIKLELNNGTLTLKAGSKLYKPNGFEADGTTPKFDVVVVSVDKTGLEWLGTDINDEMIFYEIGGGIDGTFPEHCTSGTSYPSSPSNGDRCYRTDLNRLYVYRTSSSSWIEKEALPLGIVRSSGTAGKVGSIDQVFNGFGYIGSTVFALPGVHVQAPNGKNKDGTYNSSVYTTSTVFTSTIDYSWVTFDIILTQDYLNKWPNVINGSVGTRYNSENNYYEVYNAEKSKWVPLPSRLAIGKLKADKTSPYRITSFEPYTVDSVANSNASNFSQAGKSLLSGLGMPSNRYIDLTLGASGSTYTAPANGWFCLLKIANDTQHMTMLTKDGSFGIRSVASADTATIVCFCPAIKGDIMTLTYNATGSTTSFKFYYAEGEN